MGDAYVASWSASAAAAAATSLRGTDGERGLRSNGTSPSTSTSTSNGVNPMVWHCREFFFSNMFGFLNFFRADFFRILFFWTFFYFKA